MRCLLPSAISRRLFVESYLLRRNRLEAGCGIMLCNVCWCVVGDDCCWFYEMTSVLSVIRRRWQGVVGRFGCVTIAEYVRVLLPSGGGFVTGPVQRFPHRRGQVSTEGAGNKGSSELNSHPKVDGKREGRDAVVVGVGQRVSEEDESRVIGVPKDLNNGHAPALRSVQTAAQQQQPLGPVVRWERFLPLPSLKVLLVENDDSTRQVVSALLRNCSYEDVV
ncbi:hypothetical protein ACLOJK_001578 [Asimina triloba]